MPRIEDLKESAKRQQQERVNMITNPDGSKQHTSANSDNRVAFNINENIPDPVDEYAETHTKKSIEDDIINGGAFEKFLQRKMEDVAEITEAEEEEARLRAAGIEDPIDNNNEDNSYVIDATGYNAGNSNTSRNMVMMDDLHIEDDEEDKRESPILEDSEDNSQDKVDPGLMIDLSHNMNYQLQEEDLSLLDDEEEDNTMVENKPNNIEEEEDIAMGPVDPEKYRDASEEYVNNTVNGKDDEYNKEVAPNNVTIAEQQRQVKEAEEALDEASNEQLNSLIKDEPKEESLDVDIEMSSSTTTIDFNTDEEEEEAVQQQNDDDLIKHLQKLATEKLKPVSKKLDISSFTVLKKPTANTKMLQEQPTKVAKWVLPNQDSIVLMKEYLGSELEALREYSEDRTSMSELSRKYRSIYDHIVSPKPSSYEVWLKSTPFSDMDHYFFGVYIASFKGANYLPMDCENQKCKETFLTDDIDIMDMVKFENDKAKKKFKELYNSESRYAGSGIYCTEIIPLSDKVAVSFKDPSVYDLLEIASLDNKFRDTYAFILDYIPYIDTLYNIDSINNQLVPFDYKTFPNNIVKTTKSKITKYDSILKTLYIDEFAPIKAYVRSMVENKEENRISYRYPAVTCPKCGKEITEKLGTAEEMVFTRYQLGALVNTSLN